VGEAKQCLISNISNLEISHEINGDYTLSFEINSNNNKLSYLTIDVIILLELDGALAEWECNGQYYRVVNREQSKTGYKIFCKHIKHDGEKVFIPSFEAHIGCYSDDIFADIWQAAGFSYINYVDELGMTPCQVYTDVETQNKMTAKQLTDTLLGVINQGEIYIDNYGIALVDEIGTGYPVLELSEDKNITNLTITEDTSDMITRLYAYGKDSLDLTSTDEGRMYTDSNNIDKYGIKEGCMEWSNISDPEMLYAQALWMFSGNNQNRIDVPSVSITCKYIDLCAKKDKARTVHLGQKVNIGSYNDFRITKIIYKPLKPYDTEITIGKVKKDLFYYFRKFNTSDRTVINNVTKAITTEGIMNTTIVEVTKQEVVASDVIEATAVFADDLQVERLETNIKQYVCTPNLKTNGSKIEWKDDEPTYTARNKDKIRGYIKIEGITHKYIEAHLVEPDSYDALTSSEVEALKINGRQLYFTSLTGTNAFQYFTFVEPRTKYSNMLQETAEMYKVYIRKTEAEYVKLQHIFKLENDTYNIVTQYGVGDDNGRGVYQFSKDSNGGELTYIERENGAKLGIRITDTDLYKLNGSYDATIIPTTAVLNSLDGADNLPEGAIIFIKG
jgi:hypothetical protein